MKLICLRSIAGLRVLLLVGLCMTGWSSAALAQDAVIDKPVRPRVGLVLAGGGAKGGAHVGVLKVLEELHVPISCIAGTSMGALVGGGYASGIPAAELEAFVSGIDWKLVVGGQGKRELEPVEQKRTGVTYSNNIELGIKGGALEIPGGLVNTIAIEDLLRSYVAAARMESNFDRLPIPFRAVATDMISGDMVVLSRGDLATAMRASMAIPGAFAPVITSKYILSDGGQVRNIPVDVARELCADVVIVVNLVEPAYRPDQLSSATQLLARSMDLMIEANEDLQLDSLTAQDIRIDVDMGDIATADFERVPDTIPLGEAAARASAERLLTLAVSADEYSAWRASVTADQDIAVRLGSISYEGLERVNPAFLAQRSQLQVGDDVNIQIISEEARRMSALQEFESTEYRLEGDPEEPSLVWLPKEKRWGPDYVKFDLGLYASEAGDLAFIIHAQHTRTWLNSLGAEWRNVIDVGYDNKLVTSFYQPLDIAQKFFVQPAVGYTRTQENIFLDGERAATYYFSDLAGAFDAGMNISNTMQLRAGYVYMRRDVSVETGAQQLPESKYTDAGLRVSATFDSRDTPFNPTKGIAAAFEYQQSSESLGASRDWELFEMGIGAAIPVLNDVVWLSLAGGSNLGSTLPADRYFALGGPVSFPGYQLGEVRSEQYWVTSGSYNWQVKELMSLRGQALYAGVQLSAGENSDRLDLVDEGVVYSGAVYLTGRTQVGPLTLGLAATTSDAWSLWVSVGRPVGRGTILERGIFR